jgi:hypothetical protein
MTILFNIQISTIKFKYRCSHRALCLPQRCTVPAVMYVYEFCEVTLTMCTYQEGLYLTSGVPAFRVNCVPDHGGTYGTETRQS